MRASELDPRNPGPHKVIVETGERLYLQLRAVELIHQAEADLDDLRLDPEDRVKEYDKNIQNAISFLALAAAKRKREA